MRLTSSAVLHKRTVVQDAYGGESEATTTKTTLSALVSIGSDEQKPLASGYGYNRTLDALVDSYQTIAKGDLFIVNGITFYITSVTKYTAFHLLIQGVEA